MITQAGNDLEDWIKDMKKEFSIEIDEFKHLEANMK